MKDMEWRMMERKENAGGSRDNKGHAVESGDLDWRTWDLGE